MFYVIILLIIMLTSLSNLSCGITTNYRIWLYILKHTSTSPDNGTFCYIHPHIHISPRSNPRILAYADRSNHETSIGIICRILISRMTCCTDICILRYTSIFGERHHSLVIHDCIRPDTGSTFHLQIPWSPHHGRSIYIDTPIQICAEAFQEAQSPQSEGLGHKRSEEYHSHDIPQRSFDLNRKRHFTNILSLIHIFKLSTKS